MLAVCIAGFLLQWRSLICKVFNCLTWKLSNSGKTPIEIGSFVWLPSPLLVLRIWMICMSASLTIKTKQTRVDNSLCSFQLTYRIPAHLHCISQINGKCVQNTLTEPVSFWIRTCLLYFTSRLNSNSCLNLNAWSVQASADNHWGHGSGCCSHLRSLSWFLFISNSRFRL